MTEAVKSLQVSLWAQPGGPNTPVRFLGCHAINSVTVPKGSNTLNHCPDPVQPGKFKVSSKTKAAPGLVTFTIESKVYRVFDYLENLNCPIPLIAQVTSCAPKNEFWNWDRAFIFVNADNVQESINNLVSGGAEESEVMQMFDMEADAMVRLIPLQVYRDESIAETQALNKIFSSDVDTCAGFCGPAVSACDRMFAVADAIAGSASGKANVWTVVEDVWTVAAADPFDTDENISTGATFPIDRTSRRILVFRGTTDAGAPAEAAYSDDNGATWVAANIGTDNGEFVPNSHSAFSLNQNNVWVGSDSGRIYFSNNGGTTWVAQEDQGIHSGNWNWIQMLDERTGFAGGAADVIAATVDGGGTWSQVNATGNGGDVTCGAVIDASNLWVGTDDGEIFFSRDGGVTWTERTGWNGSGTGAVRDLKFRNNMLGFMIHETASGKANILQTRNGGYTWELITTPTNSGINAMLTCSDSLLYAVGEPQGGRPVVYKIQPSS